MKFRETLQKSTTWMMVLAIIVSSCGGKNKTLNPLKIKSETDSLVEMVLGGKSLSSENVEDLESQKKLLEDSLENEKLRLLLRKNSIGGLEGTIEKINTILKTQKDD